MHSIRMRCCTWRDRADSDSGLIAKSSSFDRLVRTMTIPVSGTIITVARIIGKDSARISSPCVIGAVSVEAVVKKRANGRYID